MSLDEIKKEISDIKKMLEEIIVLQKEILERIKEEGSSEEIPLDASLLLRLPDHLRKTMMALAKLVKAKAEDVAKITGRARAVESAYLNQLVRMGYVKRERVKREVYFSIVGGEK
ncbi:MAG: helix-turn-helix domain-containing protein [Candidatus Verstraetearchaeota archaeon]|jgi:DNA-binding transcriptional ArsR family regulator|nr:helix-turn-helix domain-containing protein [Candidatus Verstraetearchaeota archaeon]